MVRIGIIGCGKIAEKHLTAYSRRDDVQVVVTDIVTKGEEVANRYGAAWEPDPDRLIASGDVDAIDICVPTPVHATYILAAIDGGKHVFCEKPLASNLEEAERIAKKVAASEVVSMVGFLYRFHPAFEFVKRAIDQGAIGDPYYAIFRVGGRGGHKAWKHKRETGGGAINEMMVHMADLALWYFGQPDVAKMQFADIVLPQRDIEGETVDVEAEDFALLDMTTDRGVRVLCQSDLITPSYMNYMEAHGTNGSIFTSILDYFPSYVYCKEPVGAFDRGMNPVGFSKAELFDKELGHFVDCIESGCAPGLNTVEESLQVMRLLDSLTSEGSGDRE